MATETKTEVMTVLRERGLLNQVTETGLAEATATGRLTVYCGFDPSAPSLQIGNLVPVMALAHFQRFGHRPIIVVGGGTGRIGDPSGRDAERPLLTNEQVAENVARFREQLSGYLAFEGENAARIVDNASWLDQISVIDFLRDVGKHFTVNGLLAKESIRTRMEREEGISYTEFSYTLIQATDYLRLFDAEGCTVQIGGSDQWGNLISGVELIRRARGVGVHAMTVPLITSATGQKFGKSAGNALWLDPAMTTPYELYQYWINIDDRDVGHYLRVFTFMPLEEVARIEAAQAANPSSRIGQRTLAFEVTKLVHGEAIAQAVRAASNALFGGGVTELTRESLPHLAGAVPTAPLALASLEAGTPLLDLLTQVGAQPSKGAARRLVQQGGLYLNDQRVTDPDLVLTREALLLDRAVLVRMGKNKYQLLLAE